MRSGRSASTRGWLRRYGQRYRAATIPHARKPIATLIPNRACGGIFGFRSKVLRPAFHGIVPDLVAVLVEHQLGVLRRREPEAMGELALELARRPAGVAECDQALARAAMVADVAQDLVARRHRDAAVDDGGVGTRFYHKCVTQTHTRKS